MGELQIESAGQGCFLENRKGASDMTSACDQGHMSSAQLLDNSTGADGVPDRVGGSILEMQPVCADTFIDEPKTHRVGLGDAALLISAGHNDRSFGIKLRQ